MWHAVGGRRHAQNQTGRFDWKSFDKLRLLPSHRIHSVVVPETTAMAVLRVFLCVLMAAAAAAAVPSLASASSRHWHLFPMRSTAVHMAWQLLGWAACASLLVALPRWLWRRTWTSHPLVVRPFVAPRLPSDSFRVSAGGWGRKGKERVPRGRLAGTGRAGKAGVSPWPETPVHVGPRRGFRAVPRVSLQCVVCFKGVSTRTPPDACVM